MKKIVENFTIVKPRTERVHFRSKGAINAQTDAGANKYSKTRKDNTVHDNKTF